VRLKTKALYFVNVVASRALLHIANRSSLDADSPLATLAIRSGFSLFEKFRAAIRKKRS